MAVVDVARVFDELIGRDIEVSPPFPLCLIIVRFSPSNTIVKHFVGLHIGCIFPFPVVWLMIQIIIFLYIEQGIVIIPINRRINNLILQVIQCPISLFDGG